MRRWLSALLAGIAGLIPFVAHATGRATCDSGARAGWKSEDVLRKQLTDQGWQIRRVKIDGGCYEVYAIDDKGQRVESYFHPVTLKHVLTTKH